ncbi:MAG: hypothetical protein JW990_06885 [Thermoleophilia bacterium]|nr:hypothetical protein [Thermoleophilia bacterium]
MRAGTRHAWVEYDPLIDEFSVQFGTADEIDVTELLEDLFLGFDHAEEGRLLSITALSPGLGKSQDWLEELEVVLGPTLWRAYVEAESTATPIWDKQFTVPREEEEALRESVWAMLHRQLRVRLHDPFPTPEIPKRVDWRERVRAWVGAMVGMLTRIEAEAIALGSDPDALGQLGRESLDRWVEFPEEIAAYGYDRTGFVRFSAPDSTGGVAGSLELTLFCEADEPVPVRVGIAQPLGHEGAADIVVPTDRGEATVLIEIRPALPIEEIDRIRLVVGPAEAAD